MRYIGNCQIDNVEYSTYFLQIVTPTFIKAIATERDLIEFLSETTKTAVARDTLKNCYPEIYSVIESNNISFRGLISDFSGNNIYPSPKNQQATSLKTKGTYGVSMLVEKGSQDETLLCLTANITPLF